MLPWAPAVRARPRLQSRRRELISAPYLDWLLLQCRTKRGKVFVAEADGRVVAFLSVYIESHLTGMLSDITDFAYSSDLIVPERYRRQGVGTALLATAQAYAARAGALHVVLRVLTANEAAISAYPRFGFAEQDMRMLRSVRQVRSARAGLPVPATGAGAPRRSRAQPAQRVPRSRPAPRV